MRQTGTAGNVFFQSGGQYATKAALAVVFAWVFEGGEPHPPEDGPYDCSLD